MVFAAAVTVLFALTVTGRQESLQRQGIGAGALPALTASFQGGYGTSTGPAAPAA